MYLPLFHVSTCFPRDSASPPPCAPHSWYVGWRTRFLCCSSTKDNRIIDSATLQPTCSHGRPHRWLPTWCRPEGNTQHVGLTSVRKNGNLFTSPAKNCRIFFVLLEHMFNWRPGWRCRNSDLQRTGRSGGRSRWGEILWTHLQWPRDPPSLLYSEYRVFLGGKAASAWRLTTHRVRIELLPLPPLCACLACYRTAFTCI